MHIQDGNVLGARWSPDGKYIAFISSSETQRPAHARDDGKKRYHFSLIEANTMQSTSELNFDDLYEIEKDLPPAESGWIWHFFRETTREWGADFSVDGSRLFEVGLGYRAKHSLSFRDTKPVGEDNNGFRTSVDYLDSVYVSFSKDSNRLATNRHIRNCPRLITSIPNWFGDTLTYFSALMINRNGGYVPAFPANDFKQKRAELLDRAQSDKTNFGKVATFLLATGIDKPTHPGSRLSRGVAADQLISHRANKDDLDRAYEWNPAHPLIQIALAKFEDNQSRATFLREYGVRRLLERRPTSEESAAKIAEYCVRAAELLPNVTDGDDPFTDARDSELAKRVLQRAAELSNLP
jgi:hypothetical protein